MEQALEAGADRVAAGVLWLMLGTVEVILQTLGVIVGLTRGAHARWLALELDRCVQQRGGGSQGRVHGGGRLGAGNRYCT